MELSIGELSGRSGVNASTIRYYEEVGLLPRPARESGRRVYGEETIDRAGRHVREGSGILVW